MAESGTEAETESASRDWDEGMSGVLEMVGRQVRRWRERAALSQAELGAAIRYTEHQVSAVERGRRIPKAAFPEKADEAVGAGGILAALAEELVEVRYPKKVRDLKRLESDAAEMGTYANHVIHGLLQTEDYIRALHRMRQPPLDEEIIEQYVATGCPDRMSSSGGPLRSSRSSRRR